MNFKQDGQEGVTKEEALSKDLWEVKETGLGTSGARAFQTHGTTCAYALKWDHTWVFSDKENTGKSRRDIVGYTNKVR